MSNIQKLIAAGLATIAIAGLAGLKPAAATPATLGFYPATDIYGDQTFHFDADRYSTDEFGSKSAVADTFGLTYGIGDREGAAGRSEIGFDHISNSGQNFGRSLLFNAKTQLFDNPTQGVRAVAGIWLAGDTKNPGVSNTGYLLASKSFKFGRIHAGVAHAFTDDNIGGSDADDTFLQLGFDRAITPKLLFAADFYSGALDHQRRAAHALLLGQ